MAMSSSTSIFLLSLLGVPITWSINKASLLHGEQGLFIAGIVSLVSLALLTRMCVKRPEHTDYMFYVFMLGTFASVVDLIISLENDGIIHGFMTQYLKKGEPYLKTAYGTLICYWDGIAHYAMYLMMLAARAWNQGFHEVGLYWVGSIVNSMLVLLPGSVLGKFGVRWSFLLNVPYFFIPIICGGKFLSDKPKQLISSEEAKKVHVHITRRPVDMIFILYLSSTTVISIIRGFAVLDCPNPSFKFYINTYEPYLEDPSYYPKIQMLVYLFYFVPYYLMSIYGLLYPGQDWMPDWSLIHAGAAAQAQFSHIGSSLHHRTPYILRVPRQPSVRALFWTVNLVLFILPQLLAYRCQDSSFFIPAQPAKQVRRRSSMRLPESAIFSNHNKQD